MIYKTREELEKQLQDLYGDEMKVTVFSITPSEDESQIDAKISVIPKFIEQEIVITKSNDEALGYQKEMNRLQMRKIKYLSPINAKINELRKKIGETCIHNDTKEVNDYESGSYFDQCRYIKKEVCNVCGKELKRSVTYGGYN